MKDRRAGLNNIQAYRASRGLQAHICGRGLILAISLLVSTCLPTDQDGLKWHETIGQSGTLRGVKLVRVENDRVAVTLLPDYGARVLSYVDKTTGSNHLSETQDLDSPGAGGIWDREGIWPPGNISNYPFEYSVRSSSGALHIRFSADLGNLKVEKCYVLRSDSTRLTLESSYRNIGPRPIRYSISQVFRLAVGGQAGGEDFVVYPKGTSVITEAFEPSRMVATPDKSSAPWWAVTDSSRDETLLLTFDPTPFLAQRTLNFSTSYVELEHLGRRHRSEPGGAIQLTWDMSLIKAKELPDVLSTAGLLSPSDRTHLATRLQPLLDTGGVSFPKLGRYVMSLPHRFIGLSLTQDVIMRPGPLRLNVRTSPVAGHSGSKFEPYNAELRLDGDPSSAFAPVLSSTEQTDTMALEIPIPTEGLRDGIHEVSFHLTGHDDSHEVVIPFAVVDEARLRRRIENAQTKAARLVERTRGSDDPLMFSAAASCAMRAEDARRKLVQGPQFFEGRNRAHEVAVNELDLKMHSEIRIADVTYILRVLEEVEAWIATLSSGENPFENMRGLFQKAFYSRVDDSLQPYTVYVPDGYTGKTPLPLIVWLHGAGGDQWEVLQAGANLDGRSLHTGALDPAPYRPSFILAAPFARGSAGYDYLAEVDVLQMLDEIQRDYAIDSERVYLAGWSMGGAGVWSIASRFPDRFAAIMPIVGAADTGQLANLRNLPIWNFVASGDATVNPGYASVAEHGSQHLGLPYQNGFQKAPFYWGPYSDHWMGSRIAGSFDEIENILGSYERLLWPKEVSLLVTSLRHNRAYWVRVDSFKNYYEPADVEVQAESNEIQIKSKNVRDLTLFLSGLLVNMEQEISVLYEGRIIYQGPAKAETPLSLDSIHHTSRMPAKHHGLSGPMSDVFYDPFLVVFGTQGDDQEAIEMGRREAESLRTLGGRGVRYYGESRPSEGSHRARIKRDTEVTAQDIEDYHIILVGTLASNSWISKLQEDLPVRIEGGAVVAGERRFPGETVGLRMIYPNPLNPKKYVLICAGVGFRGLSNLGSIPLPSQGWIPRIVEPDVLVTSSEAGSRHPRYIASFTFDTYWRIEDEGPILGHVDSPLSRDGADCSWGKFRADALRNVVNSDLALVEVEDHLYPLREIAAGPIRRRDLALANTRSPIYTFSASGSQIKNALEHMIERWLDHSRRMERRPDIFIPFPLMKRPTAVSGFSYSYTTESGFGERIVMKGLDARKTYRVAVTEYVLTQALDGVGGPGYLGWLPDIQRIDLNEFEVQSRYLQQQKVLKVDSGSRVRRY